MSKLNQDEMRERLYQACDERDRLKIWVEWILGDEACHGRAFVRGMMRRLNICSGRILSRGRI